MTVGIERAPDCHCFHREAAVREADHERRAGDQHAADFGEHRYRPLQILSTDAAQPSIEGALIEGQCCLAVEIPHEPAVQARVGGELVGVHAVAHDLGILDIVGQMTDPARHQIENAAAVGERGAVEAGQRRDSTRIDVGDQSRRRVEGKIIARILLVRVRTSVVAARDARGF